MTAIPESCDYLMGGAPWHIEEYRLFQRKFQTTEKQLPLFHEWALNQPHLESGWKIARMMFGIWPLIPAPGASAETYGRLFSVFEVAEAIRVEVEGVDGELDFFSKAWERYQRTIPVTTKVEKQSRKVIDASKPAELPLPIKLSNEEMELISRRGFSPRIFTSLDHRDDFEQEEEMRWFHNRLVELNKVLDEKMAKELARQAIINELHLRRCDNELAMQPVSSKQFTDLLETKQAIEEIYAKQWAQIEEICPHVKGAINKMTSVGAFSDFIQGVAMFHANKDNTIIDGLLTSFELQVELRDSEQQGVRYRPGLIAAINEAKAGLWDPKFKRTITNEQCLALDATFRKAIEISIETSGRRLVNLMSDGANGEYPPLVESVEIGEEMKAGEEKVEEDSILPPVEAVSLEGGETGSTPHEPVE